MDGLGQDVPATMKKQPLILSTIYNPIFSAFLCDLGGLAVNLF
jgi:hypothetical protein